MIEPAACYVFNLPLRSALSPFRRATLCLKLRDERTQSGHRVSAANDHPYETLTPLNERHVSEHVGVGLRGRPCLAEAAA
jgi:hypothetical protein